jgi:hypothetical protein
MAHACGRPDGVFSRGMMQDGFVNHVHTTYVYKDGPAVSCVSGGIAAKGLAFSHGYELYFEDATVLFDAGTLAGEWIVSRPLSVITNDGKMAHPQLGGSGKWCGAFTDELQVAVDAISKNSSPGPLSSDTALAALQLCWAEAASIESGAIVPL